MIPTTKNGIPVDVADIVLFLRQFREEFSDLFGCQVKDLISDLAHSYKEWKHNRGAEPNWQAFRNNINACCYDDGMPCLFDDIEG